VTVKKKPIGLCATCGVKMFTYADCERHEHRRIAMVIDQKETWMTRTEAVAKAEELLAEAERQALSEAAMSRIELAKAYLMLAKLADG
jgi:hypothetical protein